MAGLQLRPRLCLLDRGFFGIRAMEIMAERGIPFLMPARMTPGIKDAVDEVRRGARKKISRYTMMSSRRAFTFYLIVEKRMRVKDGRRQWVYVAFAPDPAPGSPRSPLHARRCRPSPSPSGRLARSA